jgi:DNA polymerase-3 subunit alpha
LSSFSAAAEETGTALDLDVLAAHATGVVAFMGAAESEVAGFLLRDDEESARGVIGRFREIFGDRLFVEVQDHGGSGERTLAGRLLALAGTTQTAPLLTHEVRYLEKGIRELYGALRGIREPGQGRDFFRVGREPADWSMKSPLEMSQLRPFYEAAYDNARRVEEMIPGDLMAHIDADWPAESGREREALREEIVGRCLPGLQSLSRGDSVVRGAPYREILEREIDEALSEGLGPTLLLFHGVLGRLREARVDLGPATGLALQSLCAYLLGITCFDPYQYDDRFHPAFDSRVKDTGEFELQLTAETRSEAVHALFTMFGFGEVAYLPAIERVTPAKAVRMAASVVSVPEAEFREIREIIGRAPGVPVDQIYEQNENLGRLYRRSLAARDLLRRAALLEDLPVGVIRSRRSLALSPVPLTDFLGHSIDSDSGDLFVQAGRDDFPLAHVFRVDVTSLNALSVAVRADDALRATGAADCGWGSFPIDDASVWSRVQSGDAAGIFLFEGETTLQRRDSFELASIDDLTNFLALMRSRETERSLAERFASFRSSAAEAAGDDDAVAAVLGTTRGQILYHEQVREIICALTGMGPLDGWKMVHDLRYPSPAALSNVRTRFMMGAAEKGVAMEAANRWFERVLRVTKTTISRKRVFADALLVYKLYHLKTRHEASFYAALLNSNVENEGKLERYLGALRARGMLLPLDVNRSGVEFTVEDGTVRTGFCATPGLGTEKVERVVKARARGAFDSVEGFVRRVGAKHLSRGEMRALVEAGAFDTFGMGRPEVAARLRTLLGRRRAKAKEDGHTQLDLPLGD